MTIYYQHTTNSNLKFSSSSSSLLFSSQFNHEPPFPIMQQIFENQVICFLGFVVGNPLHYPFASSSLLHLEFTMVIQEGSLNEKAHLIAVGPERVV